MTSRTAISLVACVAAGSLSCATPPIPLHVIDGTIYEGSQGPIQYRGWQMRDLQVPEKPEEAYGEACQTGLFLPTSPSSPFYGSDALANALTPFAVGVTWGNGGVIRALAVAERAAKGATLYDVRFDMHSTSVLGIWKRDCVEVHASVLPKKR